MHENFFLYLNKFIINYNNLKELLNNKQVINYNKLLVKLFILHRIYIIIKNKKYLSIKSYFINKFYDIPMVKNKVNTEVTKIDKSMYNDLNKGLENIKKYNELKNSEDQQTITADIIKLKGACDVNNKISGAIYKDNKELDKYISSIYHIFNGSNALHPLLYRGIKRIESDLKNDLGRIR